MDKERFQKIAGILKEFEDTEQIPSGEFDDSEKWDKFWEVGGRELNKAIEYLLDNGYSIEDIIYYIKEIR